MLYIIVKSIEDSKLRRSNTIIYICEPLHSEYSRDICFNFNDTSCVSLSIILLVHELPDALSQDLYGRSSFPAAYYAKNL